MVFGTDMPLGPAGTIKATIADIDAAGLPDKDRSTVYADTAERLFV